MKCQSILCQISPSSFIDSKQVLFNTSWRLKDFSVVGFCAERSFDFVTVLLLSFLNACGRSVAFNFVHVARNSLMGGSSMFASDPWSSSGGSASANGGFLNDDMGTDQIRIHQTRVIEGNFCMYILKIDTIKVTYLFTHHFSSSSEEVRGSFS